MFLGSEGKPGNAGQLTIEVFNLLKNTVEKFKLPAAEKFTLGGTVQCLKSALKLITHGVVVASLQNLPMGAIGWPFVHRLQPIGEHQCLPIDSP